MRQLFGFGCDLCAGLDCQNYPTPGIIWTTVLRSLSGGSPSRIKKGN